MSSKRSRTISVTKMSRTKSPKKGSRRRIKCDEKDIVTTEKVCGPRKSCKYPNVYSRKELAKMAVKSKKLRKSDKKVIPKMSKYQLCSELELSTEAEVRRYKIINGRICGSDKSKYVKDAWTIGELRNLAKGYNIKLSHTVKSKSPGRNKQQRKSREQLCDEITRHQKRINLAKSELQLPFREKELDGVISYHGKPKYIAPFIYYMLSTHKDLTFFINKDPKVSKFYNGINYNCDLLSIDINPDLITQMKNCTTRFFMSLISISTLHTVKHANSILYDKKENTIIMYEPLGHYSKCKDGKLKLKAFLESFAKVYFKAKFISSQDICPYIGIQKLGSIQSWNYGLKATEDPQGFCVIMNILTMDVRLRYPDLGFKEVVDKLIEELKTIEYSIETYFNIYIDNILQYKDDFREESKKLGVHYMDYAYKKCLELNSKRG